LGDFYLWNFYVSTLQFVDASLVFALALIQVVKDHLVAALNTLGDGDFAFVGHFLVVVRHVSVNRKHLFYAFEGP
jgi:hypothetical protein